MSSETVCEKQRLMDHIEDQIWSNLIQKFNTIILTNQVKTHASIWSRLLHLALRRTCGS